MNTQVRILIFAICLAIWFYLVTFYSVPEASEICAALGKEHCKDFYVLTSALMFGIPLVILPGIGLFLGRRLER